MNSVHITKYVYYHQVKFFATLTVYIDACYEKFQ